MLQVDSTIPLKCPCMRHDNLRDLNAKLLAKIQKDVDTEPALIPIEEDNQ